MTTATASREEPAWYTPSDLPAEIAGSADPIHGGLGVGAPGKVGLLELDLASRGSVTRLTRQYQRAPLHIYRPIYLDPALPGMPFIFVQQAGDGLVQGDRYRVDVDCGPGASVHLTTQAATNVFVARQDFATQLVNLQAGDDALVEYLPDPVVPFRGSRLFQRVELTAAASSTVIVGETLLPGRVAHGETDAYDLYWSELEARRPDGTQLCADVLRLGALAGAPPRSIGLLDGHEVLSTLWVLTRQLPARELVVSLREALIDQPGVLAGASELPNGCGAAVRLLASSSRPARAAMRAAWNAARLAVIGVPAPDLRKG
ncbi:MAG TPA: urease accessory protein UreD [Solirubrobacteraceae bacterium]|jgi:urease accessory protein|nr:urease accessory protein UreD [Solirubrobacteraceae bacterium]